MSKLSDSLKNHKIDARRIVLWTGQKHIFLHRQIVRALVLRQDGSDAPLFICHAPGDLFRGVPGLHLANRAHTTHKQAAVQRAEEQHEGLHSARCEPGSPEQHAVLHARLPLDLRAW